MDKFRAAPLPNPPLMYDPQYIRQLMRVVENYFSQLDSHTACHADQYTANIFIGGTFSGTAITATSLSVANLTVASETVGSSTINSLFSQYANIPNIRNDRMVATDVSATRFIGNDFYGSAEHLYVPYNQFSSSVTQTIAAIDQSYAVTFNSTTYATGQITLASSTRITIPHAGIYNITPELQLTSSSNGTEIVNVWFRKNGTDIASSNSQFALPARKSAGVPSELLAVIPFTFSLNAGDYIEVIWSSTATTTSLTATPAVAFSAGVTPAIPATPSAIVTALFISSQFPIPTIVAPLPAVGFGGIGTVTVTAITR
jgi:hypothetical protein